MVKLKRKNVVYADTPLIEGLYVVECGSLLQIRVKELQVVMSAVSTFEDLVECGRNLMDRYRTIESLKEKLATCEYLGKVPEHEFIRRQFHESQALESDLQKRWYKELTFVPVAEAEVKKVIPKRVGIKLKKVATG